MSRFRRSKSLDDKEPRSPLARLSREISQDISSRILGVGTISQKFEQKFRSRLAIGDDTQLSMKRLVAADVLYHKGTDTVIGLITLANFVLILQDTDYAAAGEETPQWLAVANMICMGVYTVELALRMFVERTRLFFDSWNWLDMVVVTVGFLDLVFSFIDVKTIPLGPLRTLRCLRLLRIIKALVLMNQLKDLRRLVRGIASCFKVLFWSLFLVFLFMTIWATVAVELLNPIMEGVADVTQSWSPLNCDRCSGSFSSVMAANLTLFQTIIGGDSWGKIAVPVIEMHPWAAFIFVGSLFTIQVGLLNLVVAVLVDTAAEARSKDTEARMSDVRAEEKAEKALLAKIFSQIDADGSGELSFEELEQGALEVEEFQQQLRVMDIQGEDLRQLFVMLDEDGSGEIDADEFIETLYRMKCGDNKTAATFVKHYVMHLKKNQTELSNLVKDVESQVTGLRQKFERKSRGNEDKVAPGRKAIGHRFRSMATQEDSDPPPMSRQASPTKSTTSGDRPRQISCESSVPEPHQSSVDTNGEMARQTSAESAASSEVRSPRRRYHDAWRAAGLEPDSSQAKKIQKLWRVQEALRKVASSADAEQGKGIMPTGKQPDEHHCGCGTLPNDARAAAQSLSNVSESLEGSDPATVPSAKQLLQMSAVLSCPQGVPPVWADSECHRNPPSQWGADSGAWQQPAPDSDSCTNPDQALAVGDGVEIAEAFQSNSKSRAWLEKGIYGTVKRLNEDGDAFVKFDAIHLIQCVTKRNIVNLKRATPRSAMSHSVKASRCPSPSMLGLGGGPLGSTASAHPEQFASNEALKRI